MFGPFQNAISGLEPLPPAAGPDKVTTLPEAIQRLVKPGAFIHMCTTHNRPGAVVVELVRAFRHQQPGLTISCIGYTSNGVLLAHCGVAKKLLSTFTGDSYPTPGPNAVIDRAWKEGRIEIENWSILTLPLRLLAGAMGVPYMPTRSLIGSSMERDNAKDFIVTEDENGEKLGLVKALRPDVAFIHAPCADRSGNTLITPPYGEDALGAYAARDGVIVTVDKIVDHEFIRRYSHLCKIPSYMVKAVCEVPFGAHPGGVSCQGLPEFESYADDYDFVLDIRKASRTHESMEAWVKSWIDDCPTWDHYLAKLGKDRIWSLKGKAHGDSWKSELLTLVPEMSSGPEYSPVEMMVVAAGRMMAERIRLAGLTTILAGVGASNLAAWLAYYRLQQEGLECRLMAELGFYGYLPRPADPFIFNYRNMPTAGMLTGIPTIMGIFMSGAGNQCMGSIGAGQIDSRANINTTLIPGFAYLTGSGGGNDICSGAREVMVIALSGKNRFVSQLPYISSPGKRVRAVISDLGVMEKAEGEEELKLTGYFPSEGKSEQDCVREIREKCGWDLKVASQLNAIPPPDLDELKLLRVFDPRRQFLGKR